jgi:hypothetical protein
MTEQIGISPKKPSRRGLAKQSLSLINAMSEIIEDVQPITGRGVGYRLFVKKLIPSTKTLEMKRVYRLLKEARERGMISWDWIVDESRSLEKTASWNNPEEFAQAMINGYRRGYWNQQPVRVQVWSGRAQCAACSAPCSTSSALAFGLSMASLAQQSSTMRPPITTAAISSCSMSAIGTRAL